MDDATVATKAKTTKKMDPVTDKGMQSRPDVKDKWMATPFMRGAGVFFGRVTPAGERMFYFRYTDSKGKRPFLPIGPYHQKGDSGMSLAQAYARACELSTLYRSGTRDLREHFATMEADKRIEASRVRQQAADQAQADALARERRVTVRQLFDRWAGVDLKPHLRADGRRTGRKDAGEYTRLQFERRVFPALGDMACTDVRKSDLLAILDAAKTEGKLRTANVLLADLKQMFRFALVRELVERNPLDIVTKSDVGGAEVERERVLTPDEIHQLHVALPAAHMGARSEAAIWLILATGTRISEAMGARWEHVDLEARKWHLPTTKNQREHTVHLSAFAVAQFERLAQLRETTTTAGGKQTASPWVFPNTGGNNSVCVKSLGKQLSDRQRPADKRMSGRSKHTESLCLPGGRWTAHDLRRTAGTLMASMGVSGDVVDECLNHVIESRVRRTYIRDRRQDEQAKAFELLGARLAALVGGASPNVFALRAVA